MSFQEDNVVKIKERLNIVDIIGEYVPLKRAGRHYKGLCPFHNEKTPSFVVSEERQSFKCFGCGEYGDVISFIMKRDNMSFIEAIEFLSDKAGVTIERNGSKPQAKRNLEKYYVINTEAARYYFEQLLTGSIPRAYLKSRGIDNRSVNAFFLGYATSAWDGLFYHLSGKGIDPADMVTLGLVGITKEGRYYDKFRNRLMFPIIDTRKRIIGFGGRTLGDDRAKYLNSPESPIFEKGKQLYGLNLVQVQSDRSRILLVEGYMDVIGLYQQGINYSVACLGTALTESQARLVKRFGKEILICYDSDNAGIKATDRAIDIFKKQDSSPLIVVLDEGKDPDDFIKENGSVEFEKRIENAVDPIDFRIGEIIRNIKSDRTNVLIALCRYLSTIDSSVIRDEYISKLAPTLGLRESSLKEDVERIRGENLDVQRRTSKQEHKPVRGISEKTPKLLLEAVIFSIISKDYYLELKPYIEKLVEYRMKSPIEVFDEIYGTIESGSAGDRIIEEFKSTSGLERYAEIFETYPFPPESESDSCVFELLERLEREELFDYRNRLIDEISMLDSLDMLTGGQEEELVKLHTRLRDIEVKLKTKTR